MTKSKKNNQEQNQSVNQPKEDAMENQFSKQFVEVYDEKERLVSVLVNPEAEESYAIGSNGQEDMENGKSALRAAVDFYRFNLYGHPMTTEGLHLYKDANLKSFYATNLGVVHESYAGDLPIPRPKAGWEQVNIRNGRFYLTKFNKEYDELRSRKHDFIDGYLKGYGVDIRVLPWNVGNGDNLGLASTLMRTWKESDDEKAMAMKVEGYQKVAARTFLNKEIRKAHATGQPVAEIASSVSGAVVIHTSDGDVELTKLPIGRYKVYQDGKALTTINWDGGIYATSQMKMASTKQNWELTAL